MVEPRNPFTPAFGVVPPVMAGRQSILDNMHRAFEEGPGNPNLSTILVGARGTGKTVCLTCIANEASACGWITASTIALPGMLEDIYEAALRASSQLVDAHGSPRLSSLTVGPISASWERETDEAGNWRTRMTRLLDALDELEVGLLICVDEVRANLDEMIRLAAVYQLFVQEGRRVALVMAGLPYHVDQLLTDASVSFLRRSQQHRLGRIADADVKGALRKTVEESGKRFDGEALDSCVDAIGGFAYMLQLVGYRTWTESGQEATITSTHAQRGIRAAQEEMEAHVLTTTYYDLSDGDLRFLRAMLPDKGSSRLADIAKRMGVKSNYASRYKSRLLAQGVIGERARNVFEFDIPGFREYLERMEED